MKVKVYDFKGKISKEIDLGSALKDVTADNSLLSQYIRVYQANQRQGTVSTLTRGEVRGGGKKPWRQKGTGRARAGSSRSPIWVGGGITHGPKPKSWNIKFNKKSSAILFKYILSQKISSGQFSLFTYDSKDTGYSTKSASAFLKSIEISPNSRSIIIHNHENDNLYKSFRNISNVNVVRVQDLNNFNILESENVLVESAALDSLKERLAS